MTREKDFNMECYPYDPSRFTSWGVGIIQPKYDGDRIRMKIINREAKLFSSSKRLITSLPHLNKEFTDRYKNNEGFEIDFEGYCHEMKHPEISGIIRTTKFLPEKHKLIKAYLLDLPQSIDSLLTRISTLDTIQEYGSIVKVPSYKVVSIDEVPLFLKEFYKQGFEGFVLKNIYSLYETKRSTSWMKYKPRKTDSYKIIGFKEQVNKYGELKNTLGALVLICNKGIFDVGTGFNNQQRDNIWSNKEKYLNTYYTISYQELSEDGIPREPSAKIEKISLLE